MLLICGPAAADPGGQLVVRAAEVLEQLLVGGRLLERVQLGAVQVLQQRVAEQVVVAGLPHDRRDDGQARLLGGAPAPLTHDQLELPVTGVPDHDRLEQPHLPHRVHELGHRLLVEHLPRLPRVGPDVPDRDLGEVGAVHRTQLGPGVDIGRCPGHRDAGMPATASAWPRRRRAALRARGISAGLMVATLMALSPRRRRAAGRSHGRGCRPWPSPGHLLLRALVAALPAASLRSAGGAASAGRRRRRRRRRRRCRPANRPSPTPRRLPAGTRAGHVVPGQRHPDPVRAAGSGRCGGAAGVAARSLTSPARPPRPTRAGPRRLPGRPAPR